MSIFSRLIQKPVQLVESRVDKAKTQIRKELAQGMANATVSGVIALVALIILFFISVGCALYINYLLTSNFTGFFIVGGIYVIILIYLISLRRNKKFMSRVNAYFRHQFHVSDEEDLTLKKDDEVIVFTPQKRHNGSR